MEAKKIITYRTRYNPRTRKVVAVCSCGWRSSPVMNGGMAGAVWDIHKEKEHQ